MATAVITLGSETHTINYDVSKPASVMTRGSPAESICGLSGRDGHAIEQMQQDDSEPSDGRAVDAKEAWNRPRVNIARLGAVFLVSGIADL